MNWNFHHPCPSPSKKPSSHENLSIAIYFSALCSSLWCRLPVLVPASERVSRATSGATDERRSMDEGRTNDEFADPRGPSQTRLIRRAWAPCGRPAVSRPPSVAESAGGRWMGADGTAPSFSQPFSHSYRIFTHGVPTDRQTCCEICMCVPDVAARFLLQRRSQLRRAASNPSSPRAVRTYEVQSVDQSMQGR